eukprot:2839210-Rhodomonas_salina.1
MKSNESLIGIALPRGFQPKTIHPPSLKKHALRTVQQTGKIFQTLSQMRISNACNGGFLPTTWQLARN